MVWLALEAEILGEFAELTGTRAELRELAVNAARARRIQDGRDYYAFVRSAPAARERENKATRARRGTKRTAKAEARPPCPKCGGRVERCPKTGKLPVYCSEKCCVSASNARHYAKAGRVRDHVAAWAARSEASKERHKIRNRERMKRRRAEERRAA